MSESTSGECLRAAWQAILRGDYAERDRLCQRAERLLNAESAARAVESILAVNFYVIRAGVAISTKATAAHIGVLH